MRYHDTHFHLDLMSSPKEIANQIEKNKIYTIAVTNSPSVFYYTQKITSDKKYIRPALGLHPELAAHRIKDIKEFIQLISETRYIGEVGLDNHHKSPTDYKIQKKVFEKVITICAEEKNKILTIHSRKAASDVMDIIGEIFPGKVIFHWYSGTVKQLERAIELGFYFSINYPMIKAKNGQKIIDCIPLDRLLIETDGPFTFINKKPSTPLNSKLILEELVKIKCKGMDLDYSKTTVLNNFTQLIG